jgi:hypothetical protein
MGVANLTVFNFRAPNAWQKRYGPCVDRRSWLILRLSTVKQNSPDPFIFAVLMVSVCLSAGSMPLCASQVSDATRCRVVNLMPPFWRFWDAAKDQPQSAQLLQFDEMVVNEHPEVYRESVLGVGSNGPGPRIAAFLRGAPANIAGMRKLSDSLESDLPLYLSDFQKTFPDFACQNSIYFLVSLGAFDGGVRPVNGYPALLFGVDVIARVHPQDELGALFDHELFHMYHRQITGMGGGRGDPLYRALWEEGLATYVSGVLNPRVSESAILGRPEDLAARQSTSCLESPANYSRTWTAHPRISIRPSSWETAHGRTSRRAPATTWGF